MQFDTTYLTEAGRSLATGTLGGLDKIQFTRAVASSHDYSATPVNELKKLTSLEDVQQTVNYSRIIKKDDTTLTMRVDFPSKDVTTAYSLYTVGFYARPENGDEIMYGVLPSSLPDYIAAYDGKSNLNDSFQTDTTVSDADNVLITVSQAGSLNEADLDAIFASKHIATIDDIKANIPATVIDGSKPADFKESVTLEKGAVDGEGNAIATTKNLADGDAETLKSAKAYADTKVSGKADDSKVVHKTGDEEISGSKTFDTAPIDKTTGNPYITKFDLNNGLSTKVTDNKDGTEQLNGVQVQPFNKLSDTIGGRNYALNTATPKTINPSNSWQSLFTTNFSENLNGEDVVFSFDLSVQGVTDTGVVYIQTEKDINPAYFPLTNNLYQIAGPHYDGWKIPLSNLVQNTPTRFSYKFTVPEWVDLTKSDIYNFIISADKTTGASVTISKVKVEKGTVATDWTPAPEDKVNVSDMRKPANQVASIDEVNAKQDKLDYTPANAANVVDRNPNTGVVSEPVDFTNLTVNGGKTVASSDDLKSLEDASWHTITGNSDALSAYTCMYRKNNEQKYVDLILYGTMGISIGINDTSLYEVMDLSTIVKNPRKASGGLVALATSATGGGMNGVSISGTKLVFNWQNNNTILYAGKDLISCGSGIDTPFLRLNFD